MAISRNSTLETYYTIMSKAFNYLDAAGSAHVLNNTNKINFLTGLKGPTSNSLVHYFEGTLG